MMEPYNITHIINNTSCNKGLGCLFISINEVGNNWPFLTLFLLLYFVSTIVLVKNGNHFLKSFTASTFLMLILTLLALGMGIFVNTSERMAIIIVIILSVMSALNVYMMRKY